jgi:hypothetical protein
MRDRKQRESGAAGRGAPAQQSGGVDLRRAGLMRRMRQRQSNATVVPHRSEMEQRFGESFSSVQVHTGESEAMAQMGARAAAEGDHIAFAEDSPSKALVAHELAHVIQARRSGDAGAVQRSALAPDHHPAEREADRAAENVMRGQQVSIGESPGGRIHLAKEDAKSNEPFPKGSEVWVKRTGYHHAGVYIGNNEMVHVFAEPMGAARALMQGKPIVNVVRTPMSTFLGSSGVSAAEVGPSRNAFAPQEAVQRATEHVGEAWDYNPLTHNCQHFSSKTVSGVADSPEADAIENAFLNLPAEAEHAAAAAGHAIEGAAASAGHAMQNAAGRARSAFKKLKFW